MVKILFIFNCAILSECLHANGCCKDRAMYPGYLLLLFGYSGGTSLGFVLYYWPPPAFGLAAKISIMEEKHLSQIIGL